MGGISLINNRIERNVMANRSFWTKIKATLTDRVLTEEEMQLCREGRIENKGHASTEHSSTKEGYRIITTEEPVRGVSILGGYLGSTIQTTRLYNCAGLMVERLVADTITVERLVADIGGYCFSKLTRVDRTLYKPGALFGRRVE